MNEMNSNGSVKQLRRTRDGRIVAGVCSGVGEYIGVDPNVLRIALAVASLFGGLGFGVYVVSWLLIPEENKPTSIVQDLIDRNKDNPTVQDVKAKVQNSWAKATNTPTTPPPASTSFEDDPKV